MAAARKAPNGKKSTNSGNKAEKKEPRFSRVQAPADLSTVEWQRGLRRQFGREQVFDLKNTGGEAFFSEFQVGNPQSKTKYRVAIRGLRPGENFCTCPDYATNELGTCKHIEFTLAALEKKRGAKAAFARGYRPAFSEIYLVNAGGNRRVHFRPGSDCPSAVLKAAERLFVREGGDRVLPEARLGELERFIAEVAGSGHTLRAYDDAMQHVAGQRDAEQRRKAVEAAFPEGAADRELCKLLKVPLYPYQAEGALFAARAGRALVCDDMGLGKTIQAIAAAEILARVCAVSRVLVICPASLKYQWQSEMARFAGRESRVLAGNRAQRMKDFREDDFCKITNYEKLKGDLDLIAGWAPELVIVDEAQRVKNWNTIAARALKRIDSPYAIVLTGTPLENKLEELISVVQFIDQHRLGPTWKLLQSHQVKDESGRVTGYTKLEKIGESLAPIMIRRHKSEVLQQLPERTDQNLLVPMTELQMTYHQENAEVVMQIVQRWKRMKFLTEKDQLRLMSALQNMRMACVSTWLLDLETDHGVKADEVAALFDELFADPEAKAVVFSQWTRTHDILIRRLEARGIGYVSFHGGIPSEKRPALVDRFRNEPDCRVFLSTDAGSTGLNLQHASILINMDLPWNPAVLEQRIARIHRMGQKRPVQIVNFIAKGTIEEGMLSRLAFKRSLAAGILDGDVGEISLGGSRLNRFMKDIETATGHMGTGEAVTPEEELAPAGDEHLASKNGEQEAILHEKQQSEEMAAEEELAAEDTASVSRETASPQSAAPADPWGVLLQVGAELVAALASSGKAEVPAHPWVERDPATGAQSLRVPLPPPETANKIADALAVLAGALRQTGR